MIEDIFIPFIMSYFSSPQWIKNSIGKVYSLVPNTVSRGQNYREFRKEAAIGDANEIRQLVAKKLTTTLRWTIGTVPAYQPFIHLLDRLNAPFEVLSELPILSKDQIKKDINRYISKKVSLADRLPAATGGSTSTPMRFYLHKGVTRSKEYAFMDAFERRVGMNGSEIILALRGRTVPTANREHGPIWMYEPIKRQLILSCDHLERRYMPEYIKIIRTWMPTYIEAYPSAVYPLARWLKENPSPEITQKIRGILLYSENVLDHHMSLLREVFNCPVLKHYGHSERVLMAASMPDDDRYFFWPHYGHFELIDETGNAISEPGIIGEIVGTSFDNAVLPFIRYRTGDLAILSERPHPLLPNFPVIERIEGRRQEFLVCADERLIAVCGMGSAHSPELSVSESMQFEQFRPGHIIVKIVTLNPISPESRRRIKQCFEDKMQGGCTAEVVEVNAIPRTVRGKHRLLIQHLDLSRYLSAVEI